MGNERFELRNVAIPLKWQLLAPKCCKLQGKRTEQQIKKYPKRYKQIRKQFRTLLWAYDEPFHQLSLTMYNPDIWVSLKMGGFDAANLG